MLTLSHLLRVVTSPVTNIVARNAIHSSSVMSSKVAVVLSGCGVYDGAEVHEASAILVHLSRNNATVSMFAPDKEQYHVINHTKGAPQDQKRNVLEESARIARGKISNIQELKADGYDAVIFPGGFGVAKNLSTFVDEGANCSVNPDVERVLKEFHGAKKPIGLCCIAPVLAARVLKGCTVTIGSDQEGEKWPYATTADAIKGCGSNHVVKDVTETCVDTENKIVTTPAFMCETAVHLIHDGIGKMVTDVLGFVKK